MRCLKSSVTLLLCILIALVSVSCGKQDDLTAKELADTLKGYSSTSLSWTQLDGSQLSSYFGFSDSITEDYTVYVNGSEDHFDIIAAVKPTDKEARSEIIKGLSFAINNASGNFKSSNENEYKKISSGRIVEAGDVLVLVIMNSYDQVDSYFEKIGAKAPQ